MRMIILAMVIFSTTTGLLFAKNILPKNQQEIYTSVEGNVKYFVKEGETVKKDTPLFFIKRNDLPPEEIDEKKHQLAYANDEYNRREKLVKTHTVSEQEYEDAKIGQANANDELKITKAKVNMGLYKAPYNCKIIKLLYPQGSGIGDGNPVITVEKVDTCTKKE